jgi:hypothetical protein
LTYTHRMATDVEMDPIDIAKIAAALLSGHADCTTEELERAIAQAIELINLATETHCQMFREVARQGGMKMT